MSWSRQFLPRGAKSHMECPSCGSEFKPGRNHPTACFQCYVGFGLEKRFWTHVEKRGPDECWLWTASLHSNGYGQIGVARGHIEKTHRVSWEIHNGPIPKGLLVLHSCASRYPIGDNTNRRCVNPAHLRIGTQDENNADTTEGKRWRTGCLSPAARLTQTQVKDIRSDSGTLVEIAARHAVSVSHVHRLRSGECWK